MSTLIELALIAKLPDVHALPMSTKMLLNLPEKNRRNPRFLSLLAQKDPVFLARLLCLARDSGRLGVSTADDAVAALGVQKSLVTMLSIAKLTPTTYAIGSPAFTAQQFVLQRCFSHSLTAQRLSRYLDLTTEQTSAFYLACLLDSVGLYAGINASVEIQHELSCAAASPGYILRDSKLSDYHLLSTHLAAKWNASDDVIKALIPGNHPLHALITAVERMVEAKLQKTPQQEALAISVIGHSCWTKKLRLDEIDLAVLPW